MNYKNNLESYFCFLMFLLMKKIILEMSYMYEVIERNWEGGL